jgi:hypothetical protein
MVARASLVEIRPLVCDRAGVAKKSQRSRRCSFCEREFSFETAEKAAVANSERKIFGNDECVLSEVISNPVRKRQELE